MVEFSSRIRSIETRFIPEDMHVIVAEILKHVHVDSRMYSFDITSVENPICPSPHNRCRAFAQFHAGPTLAPIQACVFSFVESKHGVPHQRVARFCNFQIKHNNAIIHILGHAAGSLMETVRGPPFFCCFR